MKTITALVVWVFVIVPHWLCTASAQTLTTLHAFHGGDGARPIGAPVQAKSGDFFGTTRGGGSNDWGTIFTITPHGVFRTLYQFNGGIDGRTPEAGLVSANDGNFYGTTIGGGNAGWGTLFKITPSGTLTTLYHFTGRTDRGGPGQLIQASDGCFYGTTIGNWGTVFKLNSVNTFATLCRFSGGADGSNPNSPLAQGKGGYLYGTTTSGGKLAYGTVFKISPDGILTTLYQFGDAKLGSMPTALVLGRDGDFYGTTAIGGPNQSGMVFKIDSAGILVALHYFSGRDDGEQPSQLFMASDGYFYGITRSGGAKGFGTCYRLNETGSLTTLHHFTDSAANRPSSIVQGLDGCLYGTTDQGKNNKGTIFKLMNTVGFASPPPSAGVPQ